MNSDIEQYLYYKDRIAEIEKQITFQYESSEMFGKIKEALTRRAEKVGMEIRELIRIEGPMDIAMELKIRQDKYQKIVDELTKKIEGS